MDIRFLETFIAAAELGSFAEAGRRLGLTPAGVAQRVRALEDSVGAKLLVRSGRVVRPSEAGLAIMEQGRRIVADARELRTLAASDVPLGEIRIGAISTALTGLLPGALRHLMTSAPQLEVFLVPGPSVGLYQQLIEDRIDAAVLVEPPFAVNKTLDWRLLRVEPLVLLAGAADAGADPLALLASRPFIRYDRNVWGGRLADNFLRQVGIRPHQRFELDSLEAIAVMVDRGLGVSLVPDWARPWPENLDVARIALPENDCDRRLGLLWPRASRRSGRIQLLLDAFAQPQKTPGGGTAWRKSIR